MLRPWSLVVVAAPLLGCYGETGKNASDTEDTSGGENTSGDEPEPMPSEPAITDCTVENSEAECKLYCHLSSGVPVTGECVSGGAGGLPLGCTCTGGPSDGKFFSLSSCDELEASMTSVCAATSPAPACPDVVPASGQACSHRQECLIEEFSGECSPGEAVRSRSLIFRCVQGSWREMGIGEEPCP